MSGIVIVPLFSPKTLTTAAGEAIQSAGKLFLQTALHTSAEAVRALHAEFTSMDDLFESCEDFDRLNEAIAERLCSAGDCVYVATGSIFSSQLPVIQKVAEERGICVVVLPYVSISAAAFPELSQVRELSAHDLPNAFDPEQSYVVCEIDSRLIAGEAKLALTEYFDDELTVTIASIDKSGDYKSRTIPLCELDRQEGYDATTCLYLPGQCYELRKRHSLEDVMRVVRRLRAPNGCPWDREQTHASLKNALLEECYELIDAIDEGDDNHICEELGDVLLQFALHAVIAEEQGAFTAQDAATDLVEKLIYRHPHVFGEVRVSGSGEVLKNWDALKMQQRKQETHAEVLKSVPRSFPALLRSRKVQKKAADVGFDWPNAGEAFFKIDEETSELEEAMRSGEHIAEEMGDLLFAVVNVARLLKLEPEFLLMEATDKFIGRFETMEQLVVSSGKSLSEMTLEQMDMFWEEAKKRGNRE
jgi:tetrapyrrole methylase family protein/MazG family protein